MTTWTSPSITPIENPLLCEDGSFLVTEGSFQVLQEDANSTWSNASKNNATWSSSQKTLSTFTFLIDSTHTFLIESPYTLSIGTGNYDWTYPTKN